MRRIRIPIDEAVKYLHRSEEAEVLIVLLIGVAVSLMLPLELLDPGYVAPEGMEDRG